MWDAERLRIATDAAGIALWSWNVDTDEITLDERACHLWKVPPGEPVTFEDLFTHIHLQDREEVRAAFVATRTAPGAYQIDFRIRHGGEVHWISARGQGGDVGIVGRVMFGVFLDVSEHRQREEDHALIAGEMSHRVKNLFSIASALTAIASRSAATTAEMASDLTRRLAALGHAHDLIRSPPVRTQDRTALFGELLVVMLAPYNDHEAARVHVRVPDIRVGEAAATALALVVHELATNSIKYGAFSRAAGTLDVSCTSHDDEVVVVWTEQGGPPITAPVRPEGFGSKLLARSMSGQLGGSIALAWPLHGLVATLRISRARLER